MACAQMVTFIIYKVFSSVQINNFTEEVVFRLNINCKTIFILSLKTCYKSLSLSVSIKTFEKDRKTYHIEVDAYCFETLARAMINKFKQETILD